MSLLVAIAFAAFWVAGVWWFIRRMDQKPRNRVRAQFTNYSDPDPDNLQHDSDFIKEHL